MEVVKTIKFSDWKNYSYLYNLLTSNVPPQVTFSINYSDRGDTITLSIMEPATSLEKEATIQAFLKVFSKE